MTNQPNYIQIGQVERQSDVPRNWQLVIDSNKIQDFVLKNWLNLVILALLSYIFINRNIYFSIDNGSDLGNKNTKGKIEQVALKEKNLKQNVKNKTIASIGETASPNLDNYKVMGSTEGVVELLPNRTNVSKTTEVVAKSAYSNAGPEANLFDNVSIFVAPEKANPSVVKSKEEKCWDYVRRFIQVAKAERQKFGIPISITLAQGLLESDAGESRLTRSANNHFGIKTFNKKVPHVIMKDDTPLDKFKKYDSAWQSFRDHSLLLMRDHYQHLQYLSKTDYVGWAKGLQKAGYATDRQYAEKLVKIIENLKLYRFDEA
ncbi:MAG: glucosaminidase domain-containing protein [Saprospiraceae bacterium]|nr:glucosaminidase domain-containing protein [Saprospiraceae bacterium]